MSELALKLIEENKKNHAKFLDLGNCGLTEIPEELAELIWLEELSFSSLWWELDGMDWIHVQTNNYDQKNNLVSLTNATNIFSKLVNLKKLRLNGEIDKYFKFDDLSPLMGLSGLQLLDISHTRVQDLRPLNSLRALQYLSIWVTPVRDLKPLSGLINLKQIRASHTRISNLAPLENLTNLEQIFVSGTQIIDINSLASLTNLEQLDLSRTKTSDLRPLVGLTKIKKLLCLKTDITDLRPLTGLKYLQKLDISSSKINNLSPLANLMCLKQLSISNTEVTDLSPLANLSQLQHLDISHTKITGLDSLASLTHLKQIDACNTLIHDLHPLSNLSELQQFDISHTEITNLEPLSKLTDLQKLDISNTKIYDLYPLIPLIKNKIPIKQGSEVGKRRGIYVENCPLTNPPREIVKQGASAILNYFQEKDNQGFEHLYEAKLLIIGEGGAGKTSLLRRLYQPYRNLPKESESTKGINIYRHYFNIQNGQQFRLNVWDFGGQEIYHATHQFFLTKRSLYILVDDTRKDYKSVHDAGFKYWLELVDLLGDHSPVLIFQNRKADRSKIIDQSGIKGRFNNVKDFYHGNLQQSHAADTLRTAIEFYAQQLPHIGEELPAKWVAIRAQLEELAERKPYISQNDYFNIYASHLEFDRSKALYLSEYLHDLGVFLHFQHDPLLTRILILQNQWATEAVFKILDDETVKSKLGHFDMIECQRLWQNSVYSDMHPELLALMQKFELCYQLPDQNKESWLAPQLLSPSRPKALSFANRPDDLILRYRYPFLPKGLISRLIVRMHRFVLKPELSWSSGAVFEQNETSLLAEIPEQGGEILLRAHGPERKELLSVIAADLDALNATFYGLPEKVDKLVPCHCQRCSQLTEPEFFEQKRLLQRKKDGKLTIECPASYQEVAVLALLDGITFKQVEDKSEPVAKNFGTETNERTIKIFLASSSELREDRDAFDLYFRQQNDDLRKRGLYLQIVRWENFLDAMSDTRLQDEYNKEVKACDILVSLFFTKTGKFTEEEFDTAHTQFQETGSPKIYTFFKNAQVNMNDINDEVITLLAFKKKLANLGHFYTDYDSIENLKLKFRDQLQKIYSVT